MPKKIKSPDLSGNIRKFAKQRGITINALADFAGVSRSQLYDVLAGSKSPTVAWLEKLAGALRVHVRDLLK